MRAPVLVATLLLSSALGAQPAPRALYADLPRDAKHPARNEVLHLPTHGVQVNGLAFLAAGAGRHPTFVFLHGLPGNEKGHDLAQALRRAGWNAVTFNYRGSWGSPGAFAFDHTIEDAAAVLAYLRDTANARTLGVDTSRIVVPVKGSSESRSQAASHRIGRSAAIAASHQIPARAAASRPSARTSRSARRR